MSTNVASQIRMSVVTVCGDRQVQVKWNVPVDLSTKDLQDSVFESLSCCNTAMVSQNHSSGDTGLGVGLQNNFSTGTVDKHIAKVTWCC